MAIEIDPWECPHFESDDLYYEWTDSEGEAHNEWEFAYICHHKKSDDNTCHFARRGDESCVCDLLTKEDLIPGSSTG